MIIDIEIVICHSDRIGSRSRSFLFDFRRFRWMTANKVINGMSCDAQDIRRD